MRAEVLAAGCAGGLMLALGLLATLRPPPDRGVPAPLPAARCEAWMADAIPGIGPKRREVVTAEIRSGRIPPAAAGWFRQ